MQQKPMLQRMLMAMLLCLICIMLLTVIASNVQAQDNTAIPLSEAAHLVNMEYIPSAARALARRGHGDSAALWERATAGQPLLQYQLAGSEATGYEIVPRYVLVPVEHDGQMVGLIGIDPQTGEFGWRLDHVSPAAELPDHDQIATAIAHSGTSSTGIRPEEPKLIYAHGQNYWYLPSSGMGVQQAQFVPVGQESALRLDEMGVRSGPVGFVIETAPLPSSPVERLESPPGASNSGFATGLAATTSAVVSMIDDVPYYEQDCDLWCWAASLSMFHQWWSPVRLGNSYSQQSELVRYAKGKVTCAGGSADEIHRVVQNWDSIDPDYEGFATTYKGEGKAFAVGEPSGFNDDPKTWLATLQAPVIAFVDTSGNGEANHAILVIGYDDQDGGGVVHVHDPWYSNWWPGHSGEPMYELAVSYALFDRKWNVAWEGEFFGQANAPAVASRRGMVAGIPGDNRFAQVGSTGIQVSGPIDDGDMEHVFNITLGVLQDGTAALYDSFGQAYHSGVSVTMRDPGQGTVSEPVNLGDFSAYSPALPSSTISLAAHSIPENGQHGGASFHVDPKALGDIRLETMWWVHDQDDRWHDQETVSVLDDRGGSNTAFDMPKPTLARDSHGPVVSSFQVEDDDVSGPEVIDHADSGDVAPGTYAFKIGLSDPSGILDNVEYPRVYLRWDSDVIDATQHDGYLDAGWDGSWYAGTIDIGPDRLGHTVYWRTLAYDADDDRQNDGTAAWSPVYEGGTITNDAPPAPPNNIQASDGTYTDKIRVSWNSSTHVESYKVYRSTAPTGPREEMGHLSGASYDDPSVPAGSPYYYWVKACSASRCSDFGDYDQGYRSAGPLKVIGTHPAGNGLETGPSEVISASFSRSVDLGTVNTGTFAVRGQQTGSYQGVYSLDKDSVQFKASNDFRPGEEIVVNLSPGVEAPDGTPLIPHAWQFRSAVSGGSGAFDDSGQNLGSSNSFGVALGDLDGDGDLDAFVGNHSQGNKVWLNDGGQFTDSGQSLGTAQSFAVALGDLDEDGDLDAFVANLNHQPNKVWLNDRGVFSSSGQNLGSATSAAVGLGDVDGDGDLDAFVGNSGTGNKVWLNEGGTFSDSGQSLGSSLSYGLALGDLDGDGDLDAFVANTGGQANRIWVNDGGAQGGTAGRYSDSGQNLGSSHSVSVALGDVDGDGDLDALIANRVTDEDNTVWFNDGGLQGGVPGIFRNSGQSLGRYQSYAVALGDVDGDGDLDAFIGNTDGQADRVWINAGGAQDGTPGHFGDSGQILGTSSSAAAALGQPDSITLAAAPSSRDVALGDLDGDGDLDAFVATSPVANKIWLNQDTGMPCYRLTLDHTGEGGDPTANPTNSDGCANSQYVAGESITLTPHPATGHHLDHFTGTGDPASSGLTMPASTHTAAAHYAPDGSAMVQVGSGTVAPGGTIRVPVKILGIPGDGLGAATIEIHFDPAVVEVLDCAPDPKDAYDSALCNSREGSVSLTAISAKGVPGDSLLAEITFGAVGWDGDRTALDAVVTTFAGPGGEPVAVGVHDGEVLVSAVTGDVNCDSSVNAVDALFILQREIGLRPNRSDTCPPPVDGLYLAGCDVSGDGSCNAIDAMFILQCEVGLTNGFCPPAAMASESGQGLSSPLAATLGIGSGSLAPGGRLDVPLTTNLGNHVLGAATIEVQYDPDILAVTSCTEDPGSAFDLAVCNADMAAGKVGITAVSAKGVSGDVVLVQINFQATGVEGDTSPLFLAADPFADPSARAIEVALQNGQIDVRARGDHRLHLPLVLRSHQESPR